MRIEEFKHKLYALSYKIMLVCLLAFSYSGYAKQSVNNGEVQLKVSPKKCVALRQGQTCYLEVTFDWRHFLMSDYCLVNVTTEKVLKCWKQSKKGKYKHDFQSTIDNDFALRKKSSSLDLAYASINIAWVYKSKKRTKTSWRLF